MESPGELRRERRAALATDDGAPQPDQPDRPYLELDELLLGTASANDLAGEDDFLDEDRFVAEDELGEPDVLVEPDELVDEHEPADDDTILAEWAEPEDVTEPGGPERDRRRAWVLAGLVALIVVFAAGAGTAVVGGPADSAPRKKDDSERRAPVTTPLPVPTAALPSPASTALPSTTAPLTTATTRRSVPEPGGVPVPPAPPPPPAPTTSPPATTSPPTTTSTTSPP